jgi:hypothetical protein
MKGSLILALAASAALAGSALASTEPAANAEQCLKAAFELAQSAEAKGMNNEQLDKVEELLTKMESHCDAAQFKEAAAVAGDLKSLIERPQ